MTRKIIVILMLTLLLLTTVSAQPINHGEIIFGDSGIAATGDSNAINITSVYFLKGSTSISIIEIIVETIRLWYQKTLVANIKDFTKTV